MEFANPFGAIPLLWTENYSAADLWIFEKIREMGFRAVDIAVGDPGLFPVRETAAALKATGLLPIVSKALPAEYNPISPEAVERQRAIDYLRRIIDIATEIGSGLVAGVIYAGWGYRTRRARTPDEWSWSVDCVRRAAEYARETGSVVLAPEIINRYVTHMLNTAADGVKFCQDVGLDNVKVHLDTFHMMIEEESIGGAIRTCGQEYLGYFHTCENQRGIPGTGLVPWREVFSTLKEIGYAGPVVIESYDPSFTQVTGNSCVYRKFAESGEELARQGLQNMKRIIDEI
jgi:D-psicose/D-tagatose/L-ribulose 3-epimerase